MGSSASAHGPLVLLTGATGYIGVRLLKALERAGTRVRCLARRPEFLVPCVAPGTEVVKGDCLDPSSLLPALAGVHTAFYLVHSMGSTGKFEEEDRRAARNFATSSRQAGVRRIIYLGWPRCRGTAVIHSPAESSGSGRYSADFRCSYHRVSRFDRDWFRKSVV